MSTDPNPWHPMSDPVDLKTIGKLLEETSELTECAASLGKLSAAAARCLIQGVDARHPVTGKINRLWLQDEIADVIANIHLTIERFDLDLRYIDERKTLKTDMLRKWHAMA